MTPCRVWDALARRLEQRGVMTRRGLLAVEVRRAEGRADWREAVREAWRRGSGAA